MQYTERIYTQIESCIFCKTRERFGGLSNMAAGYPISINGIKILTSEALYQACRYPHLPAVQEELLAQRSPMSAKMKSKAHHAQTRDDWDRMRVKIMRWSLHVKLAHNFFGFGQLLEATIGKHIVEASRKDPFWGAIKQADGTWQGVNALGRLLMELRKEYCSPQRHALLYVAPLNIPQFTLLGQPIEAIDCRPLFMEQLRQTWELQTPAINLFDLASKLDQALEPEATLDQQPANPSDQLVSAAPVLKQPRKHTRSRTKPAPQLPLLDVA